jgi:hypothetical protein
MLIYPPDLSQPYKILRCNEDGTYLVSGTAKILHGHISEKAVEFGGCPCLFKMEKHEFLTQPLKSQLRWIKKHYGDKLHDKVRDQFYDSAIAGHTYNNG